MKIKVTGMTCHHCEMAVRKALMNVEGVISVVTVDRKMNEAVVEGTPDPKMLIAAVVSAGYQAEIIQ
jgi:copper chaperone